MRSRVLELGMDGGHRIRLGGVACRPAPFPTPEAASPFRQPPAPRRSGTGVQRAAGSTPTWCRSASVRSGCGVESCSSVLIGCRHAPGGCSSSRRGRFPPQAFHPVLCQWHCPSAIRPAAYSCSVATGMIAHPPHPCSSSSLCPTPSREQHFTPATNGQRHCQQLPASDCPHGVRMRALLLPFGAGKE